MSGYSCTGPKLRSRVGKTPLTPHLGEFRVDENTSDFILEHFITLFSDFTQAAPTLEELESIVTVMAIQLCN